MTCEHEEGFGFSLGIDDGFAHCLTCGIREKDAWETNLSLLAADGIVKDLLQLAKAPPREDVLTVLTKHMNELVDQYMKQRKLVEWKDS